MAMSNTFELLLDIMVGSHYEGQIKYIQEHNPIRLDTGETVELIDWEKLNCFVDDYITKKKPTLKYKNYHIELSKQKAV
jgi:hypothetical protein